MTEYAEELKAMQAALEILEPLDEVARGRAIMWLSGALGVKVAQSDLSRGGTGVSGDGVPVSDSFGEQLQVLPRSASGMDQMLLAGLHVQEASEDTTFSTSDANSLLLEQGIKIGNASQTMTNNLNAKRVFKVGRKYRVSKTGSEHLAGLLKVE